MRRPGVGPTVRGRDVDAEGRCAHYRSPRDLVAIRFRCCGRWYACHACHREGESHAPERWPRDAFGERAVLCGACGARLAIARYLASPSRCPRCGGGFNPGCVRHHPLYFAVEARGGALPSE